MDDYFGFVLHYLDNRSKAYGIDESVSNIMSEHNLTLSELYDEGILIDDVQKYVLSYKGKEIADTYFASYKEKNKLMYEDVIDLIKTGQYLEAFFRRARRYCEWVIPPGIGSEWNNTSIVKEQSQKYIDRLRQIKYNDINNSEEYKENLFRILLYYELEERALKIDKFPTEERINCPELESFLHSRNALISENHKVYMYLWTKYTRNNIESNDKFFGTTTNTAFNDGWNVTDEWVKYAHDMHEYNCLVTMGIPSFPKTFQTYQKHKNNNTEKYKLWRNTANTISE